MKIRIEVDVRSWTTRHGDPNDRWDHDDTAGEVTNVTAHASAEDTTESWYGERIVDLPVTIGDTIYVVVVDYESGDTFGRSGGYYQILDAFTNTEDADALRKLAREYDLADTRVNTESLVYKDKEYYASWKGYFESTNSIDIWQVPVRGSNDTEATGYSYRQGK